MPALANERHERFCHEILSDPEGKAGRAYVRAGYADTPAADGSASTLLKNPKAIFGADKPHRGILHEASRPDASTFRAALTTHSRSSRAMANPKVSAAVQPTLFDALVKQSPGSRPLANKRHEAFCHEYTVDLKAGPAYSRAGYGAKGGSRDSSASTLKARPDVAERIAYLLALKRSAWRGERSIMIRPEVRSLVLEFFGSEEQASTAIEAVALALVRDANAKRAALRASRQHIAKATRYAVLHRAGFRCQACGAKPGPGSDTCLQVDHIIPIAWGGSDDADNLQSLCAECNASKCDRFGFDHNEDWGLGDD